MKDDSQQDAHIITNLQLISHSTTIRFFQILLRQWRRYGHPTRPLEIVVVEWGHDFKSQRKDNRIRNKDNEGEVGAGLEQDSASEFIAEVLREVRKSPSIQHGPRDKNGGRGKAKTNNSDNGAGMSKIIQIRVVQVPNRLTMDPKINPNGMG